MICFPTIVEDLLESRLALAKEQDRGMRKSSEAEPFAEEVKSLGDQVRVTRLGARISRSISLNSSGGTTSSASSNSTQGVLDLPMIQRPLAFLRITALVVELHDLGPRAPGNLRRRSVLWLSRTNTRAAHSTDARQCVRLASSFFAATSTVTGSRVAHRVSVFLTRIGPSATASRSLFLSVSSATSGVPTMGKPCRLNDVLSNPPTPVRARNARIRSR